MDKPYSKKTYVISDTHFNHKKIIEYCDRPFKDLLHMHRVIINNWNSVVRPDDVVLHLGDVALDNKYCNFKEIIESLNGIKILIQGNHDRKSRTYYLNNGFSFICDSFTWNNYIFTHQPLKKVRKGWINVHGHIHNNMIDDLQYINVCVEAIDYRPKDIITLCHFNKDIKAQGF